MFTVEEIKEILQTESVAISEEQALIDNIAFDSRSIVQGVNTLFFALKGNRDGHEFLEEAFKKGVRNFVVSQDIKATGLQGVNAYRVRDTLAAMQKLAAHQRGKYQGKIIGITGSNGKTVVKEWLNYLLSKYYSVYQSPKSYNSQIGVALSVWEINPKADLAVLEAGISLPGEMEQLESMIRPHIGVFTSIGTQHSEGFKSLQEKINEKLLLFKQSEVIIYPSQELNVRQFAATPCFSWGWNAQDDIRILSPKSPDRLQLEIVFRYQGQEYSFTLKQSDRAYFYNFMTCIATLFYLDVDVKAVDDALLNLDRLDMRMQVKKGVNSCTLIDDSYSNDLGSLKIALNLLFQQNQHNKKTVILSKITGDGGDDQNMQLQKLLLKYDLHRLILVGWQANTLLAELNFPIVYYENTEELAKELDSLGLINEAILIKGRREFAFERIVALLAEKSHTTSLEVNLNHLIHNYQQYNGLLEGNVKIMAMVKALSYGAGSFEIASALQFAGVDYLGVAYVDEGVALRKAGIEVPIMVMNVESSAFGMLVHYNLEPEIYSFDILESLYGYMRENYPAHTLPIHLKVDTGMHRLGFLPQEVSLLCERLGQMASFCAISVFSHLAASDDPTYKEATLGQIKQFGQIAEYIEKQFGRSLIKHIANTSAIENYPQSHFDMVRLGIGLYGVNKKSSLKLQNVGVLKSAVTQIKVLDSHQRVGYGFKGKVQEKSKIATVRIGYADGYDRRFGHGKYYMLMNGKRAYTIGSICMDMCMLDVSGIDVKVGDEVLVFEDWQHAAEAIGTIPYELLVNISSRLKRVYYFE